MAMLLVVSVGFVGIGIGLLHVSLWMASFSIAFFGICGVCAMVTLLPGATHLRLHNEGFEVRNMFRTVRVNWSDIGDIGVMRVGPNQMVGFNFAPGCSRLQKGRALVRAVGGWEGALPETYGMSAAALAELLNTYRTHAAEAAQHPNGSDAPGGPAS
jgi:hypothetical protein